VSKHLIVFTRYRKSSPRCVACSFQTTSSKRKTVEYQHGKKAKRIQLPGFHSRGFIIIRCSKNLQYIDITTFAPIMSTIFPKLRTCYSISGRNAEFYRLNYPCTWLSVVYQPVLSAGRSSFSTILLISWLPRLLLLQKQSGPIPNLSVQAPN
jgi:hypothetical protein